MKTAYACLLGLCVFVSCGFDGCTVAPQAGTTGGGFPVTTQSELVDSDGNPVTSALPVPGMPVTGVWLSDSTGAAGSEKNFTVKTDADGNAFVENGRVYANWSSAIGWTNPVCGASSAYFYVVPLLGIEWVCPVPVDSESANSSTHFVLSGATESTITSYGDFSNTYGEPQLRVYHGGAAPGFVSAVSASSVAEGTNATFAFPTQSNGSGLLEGFYGLVNSNLMSDGSLVWVNSSYLSVGGSTTLSSAFGVDAGDVSGLTCVVVSGKPSCRTLIPTTAPAFTQYYSGDITYKGKTVTVGSEPVAVRLYGSYTSSTTVGSTTTTTTGPGYAIVANSGSSSVSIVSFSTNTDVANIAVGAQPMALTLNSAPATATYAYVASYGNGSLAEVDLATKAVTRTVAGLSGALSVAMDPSGSYVWVGGTNYLYKVSLSTFTVAGNVPVSGSVTSLATSSAQNELVYTVVQNCCTSSSTYAANELALANLSNPGTYAHAAATPYAPYTMNGTLPSAAVLPQASAVVSANFSNGMGASATPTGFVIYDLITHQQIMTGNTPTPVRGIASDPDCIFAYFTLPDSNEYIAVPLESAP